MTEAFLDDILTPEEKRLIQSVLPAENFRKTARDRHDAEWLNHVPADVNAFTMRYFRMALFPYHLAVYYCPCREGTIHGGRGSGKTVGIGIALATYAALHPGENHLHIAPSKDQAKRTYDAIMEAGGPDGVVPRFVERFVEDAVTAPFPEIRLRRWNQNDPGVHIRFRGIGDENVELLRSHEAGTITVDEAFRKIESDRTYAQLRGCVRGFNKYRFNMLPTKLQEEITLRVYALTLIQDPIARQREEDALDEWFEQLGIKKRGLLLLYGNAGPNEWEWQRHDKGYEQPTRYFSYTATTYDNPYYGRENVEALEEQYLDDPEGREVEMEASRPRNLGDKFPAHIIDQCTDRDLIPFVQRMVSEGVPGFHLESRNDTGIYLYQVPPHPGALHVIAGDPGTGLAPGRNKWTIGVFDISTKPVMLVYFRMGNLRRKHTGDFRHFMTYLKEAVSIYPAMPGDIWLESTGPQKGMAQIAFPEELAVTTVDFTAKKPELINYARQLMGYSVLCWPAIPRLLIELGNYTLPDEKLVQDIVMMVICAAGGIWRYHPVRADYKAPEPETEDPELVFDREYRAEVR